MLLHSPLAVKLKAPLSLHSRIITTSAPSRLSHHSAHVPIAAVDQRSYDVQIVVVTTEMPAQLPGAPARSASQTPPQHSECSQSTRGRSGWRPSSAGATPAHPFCLPWLWSNRCFTVQSILSLSISPSAGAFIMPDSASERVLAHPPR